MAIGVETCSKWHVNHLKLERRNEGKIVIPIFEQTKMELKLKMLKEKVEKES